MNIKFLNKHNDNIWKLNIKPIDLKKEIEDIFKINRYYRIKKIRVFENGKSVETFNERLTSIQTIYGVVSLIRKSKKSKTNVKFESNCDIVISKIQKKKSSDEAIFINVHGNVYYEDGSRRYMEECEDQ